MQHVTTFKNDEDVLKRTQNEFLSTDFISGRPDFTPVTRQQLEPTSRAAPSPACSVPPRVAPTANRCWCLPTAKTNMLIHATKISACVITRRFFRAILRSESAFSREKNLLKASTGKHKDYYSGDKTSACVSREKSQARFKGSKYLLRGKRISKCSKRPESTQKDVPPPPPNWTC